MRVFFPYLFIYFLKRNKALRRGCARRVSGAADAHPSPGPKGSLLRTDGGWFSSPWHMHKWNSVYREDIPEKGWIIFDYLLIIHDFVERKKKGVGGLLIRQPRKTYKDRHRNFLLCFKRRRFPIKRLEEREGASRKEGNFDRCMFFSVGIRESET